MQETLNHLGDQFLSFAWPMLWQSSLLIAVVFAVDRALAKKLRASVRHALWLVVLVKLLLSPTLALPTGAAWWLFPAKPAIQLPLAKNYVVTYDDTAPLPDFVPQSIPAFKPPPPKLNGAGWIFLATGAVSMGLLLWLLFRWRQVARKVRLATPGEEFSSSSGNPLPLAGLPVRVRVKIVSDPMSPAVCGLFRPVILLPRRLIEKLSPHQLRAVLLHEAFHIRRADIWVNCAQALLQILYWWHPFVWLANARIRRVREEAVDDAVMLALRAQADTYAPTLLEVARLAFRRPLLSLGLIGIIESRSALRQRIERLVDFQPPRKAGLTLASLCGIFLFSAVALPMGQGPVPVEKETATPALVQTPPPVTVVPSRPPQILVTAEIYQMPLNDLNDLVSDLQFHPANATEDAWWLASPTAFSKLQSSLKNSEFSPLFRPRILTSSGKPAELFVSNDTHGTEMKCLPKADGEQVDLAIHGEITDRPTFVTNQFTINALLQNRGGMAIPVPNDPSNAVVFVNVEILTNPPTSHFQQRLVPLTKPRDRGDNDHNELGLDWYLGQLGEATNDPHANRVASGRAEIAAKLDKIRLDTISYDNAPLREVLKQLSEQSRLRDPEHKGINFFIQHPDLPGAAVPVLAVTGTGTGGTGGISALPNFDPITGLQVVPSENEQRDVGSLLIDIPSLTDVRLADVLDTIVLVSDRPLKYSIQDFGVIFSAKEPKSEPLFMRTFRVDSNTFYSGLLKTDSNSFPTVVPNDTDLPDESNSTERPFYVTTQASPVTPSALARAFFTKLGINLAYPPGKAVFFNDRLGCLFVKATESDLDTIERAIQALNKTPPPEIHIKARFYEVPQGSLGDFGRFVNSTNPSDGTFMGVLTDPNARVAIRSLQSYKGFKNLGEPEATVLSGRQTPVTVSKESTVITAISFPQLNTDPSFLSAEARESERVLLKETLQATNDPPPEIQIKARFIGIPKETIADFEKFLNTTNPNDGRAMGILSSKEAKATMRLLQSQKGSLTLAEPEITMYSGRSAQVRATEYVTFVTNVLDGGPNGVIILPNSVEVGPALEVIPHVLADGYTINLLAIPSLKEFAGYAQMNDILDAILDANPVAPYKMQSHKIIPHLQTQNLLATVNVWDGQTLVLTGMRTLATKKSFPPVVEDQDVLVFITPTIVDSTGARVHSDTDLIALPPVPPQPSQPK